MRFVAHVTSTYVNSQNTSSMIRVIFYFIKPTILQFVLPSKLVGLEAYGSRIHEFDHQEVHAVSKNGTVGMFRKRMFD